ncbi:unnamed protein product (macronuclear) [Paramecium tetraurelia]|uniref:Uncharacterized protein n=1 Tax=Paramecium tetraurelia TaxID=5888 RepID=A0C0S3_PARTE|nr:uncharacterized protein GSPATT00033866001 [Paramecium tetraurelia]CAK64390.1 unnamed protein product [Paramecium tetraurelia]|eukprot:XP_001431788.1 hypothetical protein (macronuclear) [Paramecium tetraurelia strain d4-2]
MKKNITSNEMRLKSAVQFKFQEFVNSKPAPSVTTRLQTGTTTSRNIEDFAKPLFSEPKFLGVLRRVSSQVSLDKPVEDVYQSQNQSLKAVSSERTASQKIIVTSENMQTQEIKRRMKFDPSIRQQVSILKIKILKNVPLKKFLLYLVGKEKILFELLRLKQMPQAIDIMQSIIEMAIGTKSVVIFIEILLFIAETLENSNQIDLAIHFYNQVRIGSTYGKQTLDIYKMRSLVGLASCCMEFQCYESGVKFLKKCLQYAWINNNQEYENIVYQKLGMLYFYLGNIEKATFYHERSINYDYELETSPLRQLSCDTLKNYLNKNFPKNSAENMNNLFLSKLSLKFHVDIAQLSEELIKGSELTPSPRIFLSSQDCSRRMSISTESRELANLKINGQKLITQILTQQEFDFEVYTPKHSFRNESSCFNFLKNKKVHPQDVFHDLKYNNNPFLLNGIGVEPNKNQLNFAEYLSKYKLSLQKKVDLRLQQKFDINIDQKLQYAVNSNYKAFERKNKILLTHKNSENTRKNKLLDETKKFNSITTLYQQLINKLLSVQ